MAAAIDKHVYIALHEPFEDRIILKYAQTEHVTSVDDIRHPILREAMRLLRPGGRLEIVSMSDIPAGSGLGSSGSFTTALLQGLHALTNTPAIPTMLAEEACEIEIGRVGDPVGKQDQYIAAVGGITAFSIDRLGKVTVEPLRLSNDTVMALQDNLLLFFTGLTRSAASLLGHQNEQTRRCDRAMIENLNDIKRMGYEIRRALETGDLRCFAELMDVHWQRKRVRSPNMTNPTIDRCYSVARANGALGGKVVGAGGGGFLMVYAEEHERLRNAMATVGLREVRVRFDFEGTKVVARS